KRYYSKTLEWTLQHPFPIVAMSVLLLATAIMLFPLMGREFLPAFNEGALNINISLPPGTALQESNRIGRIVEETLHKTPEVVRTGSCDASQQSRGHSKSDGDRAGCRRSDGGTPGRRSPTSDQYGSETGCRCGDSCRGSRRNRGYSV